MENKESTIKEIVSTVLLVVCSIALCGWGITSCIKQENADEAQQAINNQSNTVYSFQHPEIVGTNENGEVVKRYHDYTTYYGATIYEIGKTKTESIHRGKFGTSTTVTIER